MRVSKEQAARNRERILVSAARLFREQGIVGTGVDSIAQAAGLTHGSLYSQFGSKEAIAAEAIRFAVARGKRAWQRASRGERSKKSLAAIVGDYLSPAHRDSPGRGCVMAALGTDIARQPPAVRQAFTRELREVFDLLAGLMPAAKASRRYEDAIAVFAGMAGALTLARAVSDEALSGLILQATAKRVLDLVKVRTRDHRSRTSGRHRTAHSRSVGRGPEE